MNKIGIMQGRILPTSSKKLQLFPEKWDDEFLLIKQLGFNYIELLDDKNNVLREFIKNDKNNFMKNIKCANLQFDSICMDNLCRISLLNDYDSFSNNLEELMSLFENKKKLIFIIPFFDENMINKSSELFELLNFFSQYDSILRNRNQYFSLELDMPAKIIFEQFGKFNLNNIKICYDLGNRINNQLDLADEIMTLGGYINHIHVKDKKDGKNIRLRKNLDDFKNAFCSLRGIKFNGTFILETNPFPKPLEEARLNLEVVKKYLEVI